MTHTSHPPPIARNIKSIWLEKKWGKFIHLGKLSCGGKWRWWRCSLTLNKIGNDFPCLMNAQHTQLTHIISLPWTFSIYNHLKKLFIYVMVKMHRRRVRLWGELSIREAEERWVKIFKNYFRSKAIYLKTLNTHFTSAGSPPPLERKKNSNNRKTKSSESNGIVRVGNFSSVSQQSCCCCILFLGWKRSREKKLCLTENDV